MAKVTEVAVDYVFHGCSRYLFRGIHVQPIGRLREKDGVSQLLLQVFLGCGGWIEARRTLVCEPTIYAQILQGLLLSIQSFL